MSGANAFSVTGKNVTDGSFDGNVLTLTLDGDVAFGDSLSVTMSSGSITRVGGEETVDLTDYPITNNTVESWLLLNEDDTVANYPRVKAQTIRAARFWEAILDPKRAAGSDYRCTVDFGIDTTDPDTIAWASATSFQKVLLNPDIHDGSFAKDGTTGHDYLTMRNKSSHTYTGANWFQNESPAANGEKLGITFNQFNSDYIQMIFELGRNAEGNMSIFRFAKTPDTGDQFWIIQSGEPSSIVRFEFIDAQNLEFKVTYNGEHQGSLDAPMDFGENFEFPLTGRSRYGSSNANFSDEFIFDTMVHEIGHILGFDADTHWKHSAVHQPNNGEFANIEEYNTFMAFDNYIPSYRGERANKIYKGDLGGPEDYIPIEQDGGAGSAGSHWDEDHFDIEVLSTAKGSEDAKMSGMTIAAFEDQGYPIRNGTKMGYNLAESYSLPSSSQVVLRNSLRKRPTPPLLQAARNNAVQTRDFEIVVPQPNFFLWQTYKPCRRRRQWTGRYVSWKRHSGNSRR